MHPKSLIIEINMSPLIVIGGVWSGLNNTMQQYKKFTVRRNNTYLIPAEQFEQDISDYYDSIKNNTTYFKKLEEGETGWIFVFPSV